MGKRGGKKKGPEHTSGQHTQMSFKEEVSGKKQTNSLQSITKLQHLQNLAVWAAGEASIPSLGALFGRQFAATGEALGLPPDPSLFPCQRCETILQPGGPGFNCTIRVVKNRAKTHGLRKKPISSQQNNVVYKCHFCTYENLKRGTPKGHMKEICPLIPKQPSKPKPTHKKQATTSEQNTTNKLEAEKTRETASPSTTKETTSSVAENPPTPPALKGLTLLDSKKRKRNKAKPKKPDESEAKSAMVDTKKAEIASSRRRRKGWTTLKEIAESNEKERTKTFTNLSIPFTL